MPMYLIAADLFGVFLDGLYDFGGAIGPPLFAIVFVYCH